MISREILDNIKQNLLENVEYCDNIEELENRLRSWTANKHIMKLVNLPEEDIEKHVNRLKNKIRLLKLKQLENNG